MDPDKLASKYARLEREVSNSVEIQASTVQTVILNDTTQQNNTHTQWKTRRSLNSSPASLRLFSRVSKTWTKKGSRRDHEDHEDQEGVEWSTITTVSDFTRLSTAVFSGWSLAPVADARYLEEATV